MESTIDPSAAKRCRHTQSCAWSRQDPGRASQPRACCAAVPQVQEQPAAGVLPRAAALPAPRLRASAPPALPALRQHTRRKAGVKPPSAAAAQPSQPWPSSRRHPAAQAPAPPQALPSRVHAPRRARRAARRRHARGCQPGCLAGMPAGMNDRDRQYQPLVRRAPRGRRASLPLAPPPSPSGACAPPARPNRAPRPANTGDSSTGHQINELPGRGGCATISPRAQRGAAAARCAPPARGALPRARSHAAQRRAHSGAGSVTQLRRRFAMVPLPRR
jgi:hypothetical protein